MKKRLLLLMLPFLLWPQSVSAHCPLCTVGAGGAAVLATWLGVSTLSVGVFLGAFAMAMGLWMKRLVKKRWHTLPKWGAHLFVGIIFLSTILPIIPMMPGSQTFSIFWMGDYGSILNRTYLLNAFLLGSIFGGFLLVVSPYISKKLSSLRKGKMIPFQGMILTFLLLTFSATLFELIQ